MRTSQTLALMAVPAAALALGSCTRAQPTDAPVALAEDKTIELVGEPMKCINTSTVRETDVVDKYTIDFKVGSKTYRNRLPSGCPSIAFDERILYETHGGQLCSYDVVYELRQMGGQLEKGAPCGLGEFQQIKKIDS